MVRPRSFDETVVAGALQEQFWDAGYAGTSLADLMRVSGLGKGSLYAAFGDKHQLFLRILRDYTEASHATLRRTLNETPRAIDGLRLILRAPLVDSSHERRGCLLANSTLELESTDSDVRAHAQRAYDTSAGLITQSVKRAQEQGDIPASQDALELARGLLAAQQGILFMTRTGLPIEELQVTVQTLTDRLLPHVPDANT